MKKLGAFAILFLYLFSIIAFAAPLISADTGDDCTEDADCGSTEVCHPDAEICVPEDYECVEDNDCNSNEICDNYECVADTTDTLESQINDGFDCLEDKVDDCSGLTNQEIALTIMATPSDDVFDNCVAELLDRESSNHWGNVRDTALAIIALQHAGQDTEDYEDWLLDQEETPTDLTWFLEQDSNEAVSCNINYNGNDYNIFVDEDKTIDANAGSCLTRAQANFWLKISPSCYDEEFIVKCDKNFIATLLYKNADSSTIYVLDDTKSAAAYGSATLSVNSKCFGDSSCNYEATAWAVVALLETGHDVDLYIPYLIAMSETNERYLPNSFIYIATNYEDYATKLIEEQKLGDYWLADSSAYDKYYDTSLALLSVGSSSSEKVSQSKAWLYYSQSQNGCWQNSIRDTAISLWALAGRSGKTPSGSSGTTNNTGSSVTYCSEANYFCIPSSDCPDNEDVGDSYFCSSLSDTCCTSENLKSCSEYGGEVCATGEVCTGNEKTATDTNYCCTGTCVERSATTESECVSMGYNCKSSCSSSQTEVSYECTGDKVCCKSSSTPGTTTEGSSTWWIWLLVILIVIVIAVIAWIKREDLKLFWFKLTTKFRKDKGGRLAGSGPRPGIPPRPGFPPLRRMPSAPPQRRSYDARDKEMSETFRKLRDMSK